MDRCEVKEQERQEIIKRETGFKIIKINPDKENFDILLKLVKYKVLFLTQIND